MRAVSIATTVLALAAACGGKPPAFPDDLDEPLVTRAAAERDVYTLWWNGARIGEVEEELARGDDGGVRLERRERVVVRRGDRTSASRVTITIRADAALRAEAIDVGGWGDGAPASATATRAADGRWRIAVVGEPERLVDGGAVPVELVALRVARDGSFAGTVLLPARGFALGTLRVAPDGEAWRAELDTGGGPTVTRLELDRDGRVLRAAGSDGLVAVLATPADVAAPFDPPEVVEATALPVRGAPAEGAGPVRLALAPVTRALPPAIPGQAVAADGDRWGVVFDPELPGALPAGRSTRDRHDDVVELVRTVDLRLEEDLAYIAPTMAAARQARAGDCTTHALLLAALAEDEGIEVQLVTGLRFDRAAGRLVRHRWALAWTGKRWLPVDPTHGEAPVATFLLGLAVHGPRAEELATADDVAFAGTGGARAKFQD